MPTGCMTSKQSTVTEATNSAGVISYQTNVVTVVNQANLDLDCAGIQAATGLAVSMALQKDPAAKPALVNIQTALSGILQGANTNSVKQIATLIGSSTNPAVAANLTPLVSTMSTLEQSLIQKYGASTGGQIGLAIATAISNGINSGL
jgi:hypothetical protein